MYATPWYCDNYRRVNGITRYQCQHCRGVNLCDQSGNVTSTPTWTVPSYPQWAGYHYAYQNQQQPSWKITYEYKTI
ncbi:unnamed protein product [Adineta steineri]|uniref:Uncharacterized protein n=1 Tax=Adineta steineri TaxID=433720 RepID=A0A815GMU3_9BILA|nr:unnamed protein product [Adineta steineri]CAF4215714.1 unnamed protein product [Adineta steineri]